MVGCVVLPLSPFHRANYHHSGIILDGDEVLESMSFRPQSLIFDYVALAAMIVVLRTLAFFALLIRAVLKR